MPMTKMLGISYEINIGGKLKDKLLVFEIVLGLVTLTLSSFWVLNPKLNLEPLLVFLGFVIAFFDIYRRKNKPHINEVTANPVTSGSAIEIESENITFEKKEPEQNNVVKEIEQVNYGTITLEQLLDSLNIVNFTGMQIAQFVKRTTGIKIICEVLVLNIKEGLSIDEDNSFIMVFAPIAQINELMPEIITASFDKSSETDLASISAGNAVVISADVGFIELAGNYSISLKKAKILSVRKMPNR